MVKVAAKKQKAAGKPFNVNKKKNLMKKKKNVADKSIISNTSANQAADVSSDSDGDENSPQQIQKLIEPYSKDQLIQIIINAAIANPTLYTRIRDAADRDVSHRKIFVYGLGWDTTKEALALAFKPYGEIEDCNVIIDRVTGKAKGFGFVQFSSRKGAMKALKEPKKKINNRMTSCQLASLGPVAGSMDNSNRKIYVSNVQPDADPERLRAFFSKFGEIETGPLGFDTSTGKARGFALFVYKNQEGFRKALEEPVKVFEGHQLHCQKAADGKNKGTATSAPATVSTPVVQQPTPQMLAAVAATQNFGLFSQSPLGLNSVYGGLFSSQNAGFLAANPLYASGVLGQVGAVGATAGLGSYYAGASHGLKMGVDNGSLLGEYGGATPPALPALGLQSVYPKNKVGSASASTSGSRSQGAGGSFSGYPSHLWYDLVDCFWLCFIYMSTNLSLLLASCFHVVLFHVNFHQQILKHEVVYVVHLNRSSVQVFSLNQANVDLLVNVA